MTDRYERIRAALAMGPTPGARRAVEQSVIGPQDLSILFAKVTFSVGVNGSHSVPIEEAIANAALAAACDPDTIRELLAERDQLAAAIEAAREDAAEAKQNGYELGLLAAAREGGWHPIETAPKDGTRVLLWIEWSDVPVVGEFSHGRWRADTEHYSVSCGAGCYGGSVSSDRYMKPTHWRPLPAPPAIDQARGKAGQEVGNG